MVGTKSTARLARVLDNHAQLDLTKELEISTATLRSCGGSCDVYLCKLQPRPATIPEGESESQPVVVAVKRLRYFGSVDIETEKVCLGISLS